jgi:organic hydroperoxide reductase OsmC/OhrA
MAKPHHFEVQLEWTGNLGLGTSDYRAYSRNHEISGTAKAAAIMGSSDPKFRGEHSRYNPEELLVASLAACHLLWMLHLCADAGIVISEYTDAPIGTMVESDDGSGQFTEVVLNPKMSITDATRVEEAIRLHDRAHQLCFIARSMNFPVLHRPVVIAAAVAAQK